MYLMYIDESGDTTSFQQGGKRILVLTGCIIDEKDKRSIESNLRDIKDKYYQNPNIEIKSNFLRYANPRIIDPEKESPIKLYDQDQYDALQAEIQEFLKTIPINLISVVIDKKGYWTKYPAQNPYHAAYMFLIELFQIFLEHKKALGLCIIDPREGRVIDKRNIDKELNDVHLRLQWQKDDDPLKELETPRIIEKVLFSDSSLTGGIQIADLFCYPIYHLFQYNKKQGEYEWFDKISLPKLFNGTIFDSIGLKFFPKETKKDFRFYE